MNEADVRYSIMDGIEKNGEIDYKQTAK